MLVSPRSMEPCGTTGEPSVFMMVRTRQLKDGRFRWWERRRLWELNRIRSVPVPRYSLRLQRSARQYEEIQSCRLREMHRPEPVYLGTTMVGLFQPPGRKRGALEYYASISSMPCDRSHWIIAP